MKHRTHNTFIPILLGWGIFFAAVLHADPALVGHWQLDETSGTTAADASGNGNTGTLEGDTTWDSGTIGGAAYFDGSGDQIRVDEAPMGLGGLTGFTVLAWVKSENGADGKHRDYVTQFNWPGAKAWMLGQHKNGQYIFGIENTYLYAGSVNSNWNLVAATYDGSTMRLYVNGALAGQTGRSGSIPTHSQDVLLGGGNPFKGWLDDVRIYSRVLSEAELLTLSTPVTDDTSPSVPQNLTVTGTDSSSAGLSWDPATDPESGVVRYDIYRDGSKVGESATTSFTDTGLAEATTYDYAVLAVNGEGLMSAQSATVQAMTAMDQQAPMTTGITAGIDSLTITFDEELDPVTATDPLSYSIDGGVTVVSVMLEADGSTVTLVTSGAVEGSAYTVSISGVEDLAGNVIAPVDLPFTAPEPPSDLLAHWALDDASGSSAADSSGNGLVGALQGDASWDAGVIGGSIFLDGAGDLVTAPSAPLAIDTLSEFTVMAWAKSANGADGKHRDIVGQWNWPGGTSWLLTQHKNGQYVFGVGSTYLYGGSVGPEWTLITGTYDGSMLRLYEDGALVAQASYSGTLPSSTAPVRIGGSNAFHGNIDDVRIYNRALSDAEVLTASVPSSDSTPPSVPQNLMVTSSTMNDIGLSWDPSSDPETGVARYDIHRDGAKIGESTTASYLDSGLAGGTSYDYQVAAVNGDGLISGLSTTVMGTTTTDQQAPQNTGLNVNQSGLTLTFDEPLDPVTAADPANYLLDGGATVLTAILEADGSTVTLTASGLVDGMSYTLSISGVEDLAGNPITPIDLPFVANLSDPSLLVHLAFEETAGTIASDSTGNGNAGSLEGNATWGTGNIGGAVVFDGAGDLVRLASGPLALDTLSEFTVVAWVQSANGADGAHRDIAGQWGWPDNTSWLLTQHKNGQYVFGIGNTYLYAGSVTAEWTHLAATYNGTMMRLYANGVLVGEVARAGTLPSTSVDVLIGGSNSFNGSIDEFQIYSRALDDAELLDMATVLLDKTPPSVPQNLMVTSTTNNSVGLSWDPSTDPETGVDHYDIYQDGLKISEATTPSALIGGLDSGTAYDFSVTAVNGDGYESVASTSVQAMTSSDLTPPVTTGTSANQTGVEIFFDEALDPVTAGDIANYTIDNGITVLSATLQPDGQTVVLATSPLTEGTTYQVSVSGVQDVASNTIAPVDLQVVPVYIDPDLLAYYSLDETSGTMAEDGSLGGGNDGLLEGDATWGAGTVNGALLLDGSGDAVRVLSTPLGLDTLTQFSVVAWVRSENGADGAHRDIVSQWNWPDNTSWLLSQHAGGYYAFGIENTFLYGGAVGQDWTLVAGTYDGATMRLYINGVEVAQTPHTGTLPASAADVLLGGPNSFHGALDEVQLYSRVLSDTELLAMSLMGSDTTPPSIPQNVMVTSTTMTSVGLSWDPSDDPETGIDHYDIYRDGAKVGESTTTSYLDSGLTQGTAYDYTVTAINTEFLVSDPSATVQAMTEADQEAPMTSGVTASTGGIQVAFDEPLDPVTASDPANYSIDGGAVAVLSATLQPDGLSVVLATDPLTGGQSYTLSISGVEDLAGNVIAPVDLNVVPSVLDPDLILYWALDETSGLVAQDGTSGGNDGALEGDAIFDAAGRVGGAVSLDGSGDNVRTASAPLALDTLSGFTVAVWAKSTLGAAGHMDLVSQWNWPGDAAWILAQHSSGQYSFNVGLENIQGGSVTANWTLVAATYDGSVMRLYMNGVEVASKSGLSGNLPSSAADLVIGAQQDAGDSNYFNGLLDEVKIFSRVLTQPELVALANVPTDQTPPSVPENLTETSTDVTSLAFSWDPATDPETGIDHYEVYRDGVFLAQAFTNSFTDAGLTEDTTYSYQVLSVNGEGLTSALSTALNITTLPDLQPPVATQVQANQESAFITFDEPVDPVTATDLANYSIDGGASILGASLSADGLRVTLTTSGTLEGVTYTLSVSGVQDVAGNPIAPVDLQFVPVFGDLTLVAHWTLDDGAGVFALDETPNQFDGLLEGNPLWVTEGKVGGAIDLDGIGDSVRIDSAPMNLDSLTAFTVSLWVKNASAPGAGFRDLVSQWSYPSDTSWVLSQHSSDQYSFTIDGTNIRGGTVTTDWTLVTGTYDGATMRLYVDGVEVNALPYSGGLPASLSDVIIGGQDGSGDYFDGYLDDVRIYDRALPAQEVLDSYNNVVGIAPSAPPITGEAPQSVQFSANALVTDIDTYLWEFGDGNTSTEENPNHQYTTNGSYTVQLTATTTGGTIYTSSFVVNIGSQFLAPTIELWYGDHQNFGNLGTSQMFLNLLGNVQAAPGGDIVSLSYSLNGGNYVQLTVGPDLRRIAGDGDFNIDVSILDALDGLNMVEIVAVDDIGEVATKIVTFDYDSTNVWPLPFSITWNNLNHIQEAAQVVDGHWQLVDGGVRIPQTEYDRTLTVGDLLWDTYEVTVPITVNDYDAGYLGPKSGYAGFGIILRWVGHTDSPAFCPQPRCGWLPSAADDAWYDMNGDGPLRIGTSDDGSVDLDVGITYIWKFRVEDAGGGTYIESLKVWEQGTTEPTEWNVIRATTSGVPAGSIIFVAHHVDLTLGDLQIVPLP